MHVATILAALAVAIALQALRLAAKPRTVIQVIAPDVTREPGGLCLPWFVDEDAKRQLSPLMRTYKGGH